MSLLRIYHALVPDSIRQKLQLGRRVIPFVHKIDRAILPLKIALSLPVKTKLKKIHFDVQLTEHCNLNCAGCNHFSSLAEPSFMQIEEFERDMERMGNLFTHECDFIFLMGGEPLLHPEINAFMKIARKNFEKGLIIILTNGILLPSKGEDFWQACHDNDIQVRISNYPVQIDFEKINLMARKFGVVLEVEERSIYSVVDTFQIRPLDLSGKGSIMKNFAYCPRGNLCIILSHGKLFTCTIPAEIRHFNKRFDVNIPVTEDDYIDIYKAPDKDFILQRLSEPIPICRYCKAGKDVREIKWHVSKGEMQEWL